MAACVVNSGFEGEGEQLMTSQGEDSEVVILALGLIEHTEGKLCLCVGD